MAYDASMGAASSAYGMGLSYLESAKGIYLQFFFFCLLFFLFLFLFCAQKSYVTLFLRRRYSRKHSR